MTINQQPSLLQLYFLPLSPTTATLFAGESLSKSPFTVHLPPRLGPRASMRRTLQLQVRVCAVFSGSDLSMSMQRESRCACVTLRVYVQLTMSSPAHWAGRAGFRPCCPQLGPSGRAPAHNSVRRVELQHVSLRRQPSVMHGSISPTDHALAKVTRYIPLPSNHSSPDVPSAQTRIRRRRT